MEFWVILVDDGDGSAANQVDLSRSSLCMEIGNAANCATVKHLGLDWEEV
jgi:hypothetical protein